MTPPSKAVREKVKDYVLSGRVRIITATRRDVDALVLGSSPDPYAVGFMPGEGWFCSCPARVDSCAHVLAVALVWRPFAPGVRDEAAFADLALREVGEPSGD